MISLKRTSTSLLLLLSTAAIVGSCRSRETSQTKDIFTATSEGSVYVYRRSDNKIQIRKCPDYAPLKEANRSEDIEKQLVAYCPETNANQKEFPIDSIRTKLAEDYAKSYIQNDQPIDKELVDAKLSAEQLKQQSIDQANQRKDKTLANIKAIQEELAKLEAYFANNPELLNAQVKARLAELKNQLSTHQAALTALTPEAIQTTAEKIRADSWAKSYADFMQKNLFQILFDNNQMKKLSPADPLQKRLLDTLGELWNLSAAVTLGTYDAPRGSVNSIAFSPDGNQVAIGLTSGSQTARIYDLKGNLTQTIGGRSAIFSPDHKTILTSVSDNVAKFWDFKGNLIRTIDTGTYGDRFTFSPDGTKFLSIAENGIAKLWDLDGLLLHAFKTNAPITSAAFSPNGTNIITVEAKSAEVTIWDLNGTAIHMWDSTTSSALILDGTKILRASNHYLYGCTVATYDLKNSNLIHQFKGRNATSACSAFSPDGTKILTNESEKPAILWDINGNVLTKLAGATYIKLAAFSPDGKKILTASYENEVKLWDLDLLF